MADLEGRFTQKLSAKVLNLNKESKINLNIFQTEDAFLFSLAEKRSKEGRGKINFNKDRQHIKY